MTRMFGGLHARKSGIRRSLRIPRGRSDDLDGFVLGEGLVPGGSFSSWESSNLIDEGSGEGDGTKRFASEDERSSNVDFDGFNGFRYSDDSDDVDPALDFGFSRMVDRRFAKKRRFAGKRLPPKTLIVLAVCAAALACGIAAFFWLTGAPNADGAADGEGGGSASEAQAEAPQADYSLSREVSAHARLSQGQMNAPVAAYRYEGSEHEVVARDVMNSTHGFSSVGSDGMRAAPTATATLAYILEDVLVKEAATQGITVRESEIATKATALYGTSRYDEVAASFGVSADDVRASVERACAVEKLRSMVAPKGASVEAPVAPSAETSLEPSAVYGSYIVGLLGDEWDAEAGAWARTDGPFYQVLKDEAFEAESATYVQASLAYSVASRQSGSWDAYLEGIRSGLSVILYGVF